MKKFTYSPPKIKASTKWTTVLDEEGNAVCEFKRTYKNPFTRMADAFLDYNYFVQVDVFSNDGVPIFQCKKIPRWGKTQYQLVNIQTNKTYHITYQSWQVVVPEFRIISDSGDFTVKKEIMDWARFYYKDNEVARWRMKTSELFKTYLEIEENCPIQDPGFFVCLFQCIFYMGQ